MFVYGRGDQDARSYKKKEFDYTVGPGWRFCANAPEDAALIVLGSDYFSTGGRKAAFIAGLVLGVVMPLGRSFMTASLINLKTGDVLWMGFDSSTSMYSRELAPDEKSPWKKA